MAFGTRYTVEKLVMELKLLRSEDFGALVPLCIGIESVLWADEGVESCFRNIQFLGFEMHKQCQTQDEPARWESLRQFLFSEKGFELALSRSGEVSADTLLFRSVLQNRSGHPLAVVLVLLHLAHILDLPLALIQARHHFLLKWVRSGKTIYLDLFNQGRALNDQEMIQVLNRSSSSLEIWSAKQLLTQYLELLMQVFERSQDLSRLLIIFNLLLQMDDTNTEILGQRALLRQKLGYTRDALGDLKRYFSFVERHQAPIELQQAWLDLEHTKEPAPRSPTELLH